MIIYEPIILPTGRIAIRNPAGGNLPVELSGIYTSMREANKAIDAYAVVQELKPVKSKKIDLPGLG